MSASAGNVVTVDLEANTTSGLRNVAKWSTDGSSDFHSKHIINGTKTENMLIKK